jgi:hypothetical protein
MNKELADIALGVIRRCVLWGVYHSHEIVEEVEDSVYPDEIDREWIEAQMEEEFRRKQAVEATWTDVTDCDRLEEVFESLWDQGIIGLEAPGNTQDEGLEDVTQHYHEAGGEQSDIVGYCYYVANDLPQVLEKGILEVTYGDIRGDDGKGVEIGRRVVSALEAAGFTVEWDGAIQTRLSIMGLRWQMRRW